MSAPLDDGQWRHLRAAFWQRMALLVSWPRHAILTHVGRWVDSLDRRLQRAYWECLDRRNAAEGKPTDVPF